MLKIEEIALNYVETVYPDCGEVQKNETIKTFVSAYTKGLNDILAITSSDKSEKEIIQDIEDLAKEIPIIKEKLLSNVKYEIKEVE